MCLRVATFARLTLPADVSSLIDDIFVALFLFTAAANVYRAWVLNEGDYIGSATQVRWFMNHLLSA